MEKDITDDLSALEGYLDVMLDRVKQNSLTLKRFQEFEIRLLNQHTLLEIIECLLKDAQGFFDLEIVTLCLLDEKGEIEGFLHEADFDFAANPNLVLIADTMMQARIKDHIKPYLGHFEPELCERVFPVTQPQPVSVAVIPLIRRGRHFGTLNFGSCESNRFIHEMATDFIEHLVAVVSICLENQLHYEIMRRESPD